MHRRLFALALLAAACTTSLSVSRRSRANDTGEDRHCAFECSLGSPTTTPDSSNCYDRCVDSKEQEGCTVSGRAR